jgi:glycosyltransferase involved in cell wall biosynthesis
MTCPLVAIVTPVYNGAEFLAETMNCVQAQTYPNVVHVILNNNSSDGTAEIIERYRNGRVPILVFRNDETLPYRENWNKALSHAPADAKYLRLLCADDTYYPDSTEKMVNLAERHPGVGVIGCLHWCDGGVDDFKWPKDRETFGGLEATRMFLLGQGKLMPVQMMFRKSVSDGFQPFYPPALKGAFDMDAMLALLSVSDFGFVHESLGFTRVHANSNTSQNFGSATRSYTSDNMHFLTTYGPKAFGPDYPKQLKRFRRYYVRRILGWARKDKNFAGQARHLETLQKAGTPFSATLLLDAMVDLVLIRLGMRQRWTGYPGWQ